MDMQAYFTKLFGYDKWASTLLLNAFAEKTPINPRIYELLSHMQSTQRIWLDRCLGLPQSTERFMNRTPGRIREDIESYHQAWIDYIRALQPGDFDRFITYTNSAERVFSTQLQDIITQVINHGTHHRGTIIALMKEEGFPPPSLDYIAWLWAGNI